jgi:hypothetical protein
MRTGIKTKLISRKHVKAFALMIAEKRFHRFTPVGDEFFVRCESHLKEFIRSHVRRLPSRGKTIK